MNKIARNIPAVPANASREPLRLLKRRETGERIAAAAFSLFVERGFDGTSIDAIAEHAGISRRTFFYYFPSKEDIIYSDKGELENMAEAAQTLAPDLAPIDAVEAILIRIIRCYDSPNSVAIDRVMRSTPALMERRHFHYERRERNMFAALQAIWPDPARAGILRAAAMSGVGALRMAADAWSEQQGKKPLRTFIRTGFQDLREGLGTVGV